MRKPNLNHCFKSILFSLLLFGIPLSFAQAKENFKVLHVKDLASLQKKKETPIYILDANTDSTRKAMGLIPNAKPLSSSTQYDTAKELPRDKKAALIFYCANEMCTASHSAAQRALDAGYSNVSVMSDGIDGWKAANMPTDSYQGSPSLPVASTPQSNSELQAITPQQAFDLIQKNEAVIVDVREQKERAKVIAAALWIPMSEFQNETKRQLFMNQLPKTKKVVFHCAAGFRAKKAAEELAKNGYSATYFEGINQWTSAGYSVIDGNTTSTVEKK